MSAAERLPAGLEIDRLDVARDLDGVLTVDAASFVNHWTREMFLWEAEHSDVARVFVCRTAAGMVVAYCAVWLIFDELHVNNLAIRVASRRRGLARGLLAAVLAAAAGEGATRATLEVRESNHAARRLYERAGFVVAARRRQYYSAPVEDALVMWREGLSETPPARLETPGSEC